MNFWRAAGLITLSVFAVVLLGELRRAASQPPPPIFRHRNNGEPQISVCFFLVS